jgi:hypothetical protein
MKKVCLTILSFDQSQTAQRKTGQGEMRVDINQWLAVDRLLQEKFQLLLIILSKKSFTDAKGFVIKYLKN